MEYPFLTSPWSYWKKVQKNTRTSQIKFGLPVCLKEVWVCRENWLWSPAGEQRNLTNSLTTESVIKSSHHLMSLFIHQYDHHRIDVSVHGRWRHGWIKLVYLSPAQFRQRCPMWRCWSHHIHSKEFGCHCFPIKIALTWWISPTFPLTWVLCE